MHNASYSLALRSLHTVETLFILCNLLPNLSIQTNRSCAQLIPLPIK